MSYIEFQEYITMNYDDKDRWVEDVMIAEMAEILKVSVMSVVNTINPKKRRNCFELLG